MNKHAGAVPHFTFELLDALGLRHFSSTREGGVSQGSLASLNLGLNVADDPAMVSENRRRIMAAADLPFESLTNAQQRHTTNVVVIGPAERGRGREAYADTIPDCDALITDTPGITLVASSADCVPIILFDPVRNALGTVHAGWRGTAGRIAQKTVEAMVSSFGCEPSDIFVGIGPCISAEAYHVGSDVAEAFANADLGTCIRNGFCDLEAATVKTLIESGVSLERIERSGLCTYSNPDLFFSYRRDRSCGRTLLGAMLA